MKLRYKNLLSALPMAALLLFLIGAGRTEQPRLAVVETAPLLAVLVPGHIAAGSPAFTLTVKGNDFAPGAVVRWNGAERETVYVNGTVVQAQIAASDVAESGIAHVTVVNPVPLNEPAGVSNVLAFLISQAALSQP